MYHSLRPDERWSVLLLMIQMLTHCSWCPRCIRDDTSLSLMTSLCLVTAICMSSYTRPSVGDQSGAAAAGDDTAAVNSLVSRCTMNRKAFIELCVTSMVIGALLTVSIIALKAILEQLPVVSSWHIPLLWCVSGPLLYLLGAECDTLVHQHAGTRDHILETS